MLEIERKSADLFNYLYLDKRQDKYRDTFFSNLLAIKSIIDVSKCFYEPLVSKYIHFPNGIKSKFFSNNYLRLSLSRYFFFGKVS